ncbi:hypothetical protein IW261DRAFT_1423847 [Armillaria novae-zelandiae]|uniref:Uncharacterized protein n=1 Tax=Armillaria novae-zelandiae TaxID=153914 RepID=A0AA39NWC3_9AGAR|nr:hypothetical protein IW261DRAFT_1423847 [Armillaria novae-zelandiae]
MSRPPPTRLCPTPRYPILPRTTQSLAWSLLTVVPTISLVLSHIDGLHAKGGEEACRQRRFPQVEHGRGGEFPSVFDHQQYANSMGLHSDNSPPELGHSDLIRRLELLDGKGSGQGEIGMRDRSMYLAPERAVRYALNDVGLCDRQFVRSSGDRQPLTSRSKRVKSGPM